MATQQPLTQEQLLTAIDRAIDLYQACQPIEGMIPSARDNPVSLADVWEYKPIWSMSRWVLKSR